MEKVFLGPMEARDRAIFAVPSVGQQGFAWAIVQMFISSSNVVPIQTAGILN